MVTNPCYDTKTKTDCPNRCQGCMLECEKWAMYELARRTVYDSRMYEALAASKTGTCVRMAKNNRDNIKARQRGRKQYY